MSSESVGTEADTTNGAMGGPPKRGLAARIVIWGITLLCFWILYGRLSAAAARDGKTLVVYLALVFARVHWPSLLALLVPYSLAFFLIDSVAVWRVVNWFNAKVRYRDILPVRASTYILSIVNEQIGKGAMALYLQRREGVPGWQIGSSMLFLMFCEFYYLLAWATLGYFLHGDTLPAEFRVIPVLALGALAFFGVFHAYFRGRILPGIALRERQIFHAFREARLGHYLGIVAIKSPALLVAVVVYTLALRLFGVELSFGQVLGYLPVIFFGAGIPGPMRTVAITLWVLLLPQHAGEMAAFALVMHNFFIFFNAAIGMLFMRRVQAEISSEKHYKGFASHRSVIDTSVVATSAHASADTSSVPGQPRPSASRTTGTPNNT